MSMNTLICLIGQLGGNLLVLPPKESNLGHQDWQQECLPAEPFLLISYANLLPTISRQVVFVGHRLHLFSLPAL